MDCNIVQHRANIGLFYSKAGRLPRKKLVCYSNDMIIPFILLTMYGWKYTLRVFRIFTVMQLSNNDMQCFIPSKPIVQSERNSLPLPNQIIDFSLFNCIFNLLVTFLTKLLLLLCNDVHENPGPTQNSTLNDLSVMHLNICGLRFKIDILNVEASKFDIITLSETKLTESYSNETLQLPGFHPPI